MRAILIATGEGPGIAPLDDRYPVPLLPLVDRPFLQHVVEFLAHRGVLRFDFVLSHFPEKIEQLLEDGKRWGSSFTHHLARDANRPYRLLKTLDLADSDPILLGHADRLPPFTIEGLRADSDSSAPVLFHWRNAEALGTDTRQWTGWAILRPSHLANLSGSADEKDLQDHLTAAGAVARDVGYPLSVETVRSVLLAHRAVLQKEFPGLLLGAREVEPGVWMSRNVMLHPTARIEPPVYIGEDCQIGAATQLGPHAVIGKGCMLDRQSTISNAVVFPGSYVGEGLELSDALVDKNRLVHAELGGTTIVENFILGSLAGANPVDWFVRQLGRIGAGLVLALLSPVLLASALGRKLFGAEQLFHDREVVYLPASSQPHEWETYDLLSLTSEPPRASFADFWLRFLPGLWHVVRGDLSFVGVPPRTPEEVEALPPDWRSVYLRAKGGLITEAMMTCGSTAGADDLYAADGFYAVAAGWKHDLRLLSRYMLGVVFGRWKPVMSD